MSDLTLSMFSNAYVNRGAFLLTDGLFFVVYTIMQLRLVPCTWVVVRCNYCKKNEAKMLKGSL